MKISDKGIELIKHFEGCELHAYKDIVGVVTIGYGHTGSDVAEGQTVTEEEAEEILRKELPERNLKEFPGDAVAKRVRPRRGREN